MWLFCSVSFCSDFCSVLFFSFLSCLVLSCLVLSSLVLFCLLFFCIVLSSVFLALFTYDKRFLSFTLFCTHSCFCTIRLTVLIRTHIFYFSYLILSYLIFFSLILSYLFFSSLILPYLVSVTFKAPPTHLLENVQVFEVEKVRTIFFNISSFL